MKYLFYKFTAYFLVSFGLIIWGAGYFLYEYTNIPSHIIFLLCLILQTVNSFYCGILINKLHQYAYTDTLTNLSNRKCFYEKLVYELEAINRTKSEICLAIIDIDDFKNVNDTYGHMEGDRVLQQLARLLQSNVRAIDTVARWGGEEFTIIFPNTSIQGALVVAERLRAAVENYPFSSKITISIGLVSTKERKNIDCFIKIADEALYKAKQEKNMVLGC